MVLSLPRLLAIGATVLVLLLAAAPASAQLFFSTQPNTGFHVGPLIVRANVNPGDPVAHVNVQQPAAPRPIATVDMPQPVARPVVDAKPPQPQPVAP